MNVVKPDARKTALWLEMIELRGSLSRDEFESARAALDSYPVAKRMLEVLVQVIARPKGDGANHARLARTALSRVLDVSKEYAANGLSLGLVAKLLGGG